MEFLMVSQVLGLQEDFSHLNIYPNHLCGQCKQTVNSYKAFKEEALRNEIFLVKCQADIKRIGLEKANEQLTSQSENSFSTETVCDNLYKPNDREHKFSGQEDIKEEELDITSEAFDFLGHNSESEEEIDNEKEEEDGGVDNEKEEEDEGADNEKEEEDVSAEKQCCHCEKVLSSVSARVRHEKDFHGTQKEKCMTCGKYVKHMEGHISSQHPEQLPEEAVKQPGRCILCQKDFKCLKKHNAKLHIRMKCTYPDCSSVLKNLIYFKNHIKVQHKKRVFKACTSCGINIK